MATRMTSSSCPGCHKELSGAIGVEGGDEPPKPDDLTVCLHCLASLRFDADLMPRLLDQAAIDALAPEDRRSLEQCTALIRDFKRGPQSVQRHMGPITKDESEAMDAIAKIFQKGPIPHGRAVFLFGAMTRMLVGYAVEEHNQTEASAIATFFKLYTNGLGLQMVDELGRPMEEVEQLQ